MDKNIDVHRRVLGDMVKGHLFQGNKGQILRGPGEQRQYQGTGNIRKQIFQFGRNKGTSQFMPGEQVPPSPGGGGGGGSTLSIICFSGPMLHHNLLLSQSFDNSACNRVIRIRSIRNTNIYCI